MSAVAMLAPSPARMNVFEFVRELIDGNRGAWIVFGVIVGIIAFFALYENMTGKSFVKSKEERREARRRRKHVVWESRRDD